MPNHRFVPAAAVALAAAAAACAQTPFDPLLPNVPATANTLVLVNAEKAFASPVAKAEKWAESYRDKAKSGLSSFPADVKQIVIGSETNLRTFTRDWQLSVSRVVRVPDMKALAAREGGAVDSLENRNVVLSPRDVYYVGLTGEDVAAWYPANRQLLAKWLRAAPRVADPKNPAVVSPYLKSAVARFGKDSPFVVALDTADAFDRGSVRAGLEASPSLAGKKVNLDYLADVISKMKGITLAVDLTDHVSGTLRVDLQNSPDGVKHVMKDLVIEVLEMEGASFTDLRGWELSTDGYAVVLKGNMSKAGLSRLLTLFEFPHPGGEAAGEGQTAGMPNAPTTRRYLAAVAAYLGEVRDLQGAADYTKTAAWHDATARKIEQLATTGADPAAVAFARRAAAGLRAIGGSLRGVPIDLDAIGRASYYQAVRTGGWGWWGGGAYVTTNYPQILQQQADVVRKDAEVRGKVWLGIDQGFADLKAKLTDKYKTGF